MGRWDATALVDRLRLPSGRKHLPTEQASPRIQGSSGTMAIQRLGRGGVAKEAVTKLSVTSRHR